jgi:hypothetical protein
LFNALRSAEEVDGKIQLESNLYFPVEPHHTLVVRNADKHIFRLFDELLLKGGSVNSQTFKRMVIVGPEGTGKVRFLSDNFNVVNSNCYFYFINISICLELV